MKRWRQLRPRKASCRCVEEHNRTADHLATLKLKRLNERKAKTAAAVASRSGAQAMEDEDPALMRGIVKATLYKRGTFKAAEDARLAVLASEDVLVIAEREAQIEAYKDLARPIYQLLHQLVPMNEKLGRAQIAHYLPRYRPATSVTK
jgi:hypothetical protein